MDSVSLKCKGPGLYSPGRPIYAVKTVQVIMLPSKEVAFLLSHNTEYPPQCCLHSKCSPQFMGIV